MSLVLDGTTIAVLAGPAGWNAERVPLFDQERMPTGVLRSAISDERWWFWRWTAQTPPRNRATLQAWETLLKAPGLKVASGYLVGGGTVNVYVRTETIQRTESQILEHAALSFTLEEADPAAP